MGVDPGPLATVNAVRRNSGRRIPTYAFHDHTKLIAN